jgi:hypothetical protein
VDTSLNPGAPPPPSPLPPQGKCVQSREDCFYAHGRDDLREVHEAATAAAKAAAKATAGAPAAAPAGGAKEAPVNAWRSGGLRAKAGLPAKPEGGLAREEGAGGRWSGTGACVCVCARGGGGGAGDGAGQVRACVCLCAREEGAGRETERDRCVCVFVCAREEEGGKSDRFPHPFSHTHKHALLHPELTPPPPRRPRSPPAPAAAVLAALSGLDSGSVPVEELVRMAEQLNSEHGGGGGWRCWVW